MFCPLFKGKKHRPYIWIFLDLTLQNPKDFPCWSILVTHRKTSRTLTWPSHDERRTNSILFGSGRQKLTDFLGQSSGHSLLIREMRVCTKKGVTDGVTGKVWDVTDFDWNTKPTMHHVVYRHTYARLRIGFSAIILNSQKHAKAIQRIGIPLTCSI